MINISSNYFNAFSILIFNFAGIKPEDFGEHLMASGLVLNDDVRKIMLLLFFGHFRLIFRIKIKNFD